MSSGEDTDGYITDEIDIDADAASDIELSNQTPIDNKLKSLEKEIDIGKDLKSSDDEDEDEEEDEEAADDKDADDTYEDSIDSKKNMKYHVREEIRSEENRQLAPIMSLAEKANLISARIALIEKTGVSFNKEPKNDVKSIALQELIEGRCPYIIKRQVGEYMKDGILVKVFEYWKANELILPQE